MNQTEIAEHQHYKRRIPHYPALPKFITLKSQEKYKNFPKGLKDSCLQGFRKRLSNWLRDEHNATLHFIHTPKAVKEAEGSEDNE